VTTTIWAENKKIVGDSVMLQFVQQHSLGDFYTIGAKQFPKVIEKVCSTLPVDFGLLPDDERGMPGEKRYMESGWSRNMLGRYFAAGLLCKKKNVLELCSGLGWGAYILSHFASEVSCLDLNEDIMDRAKNVWRQENMKWHCGNALQCDTQFDAGTFSAVTFMEAIEHFTCEDGFSMIKKIHYLLESGGIFVASSYFPSDRKEANRVCAKNPHHLYIFTEQEIRAYCKNLFQSYFFVDNLLFVAVK